MQTLLEPMGHAISALSNSGMCSANGRPGECDRELSPYPRLLCRDDATPPPPVFRLQESLPGLLCPPALFTLTTRCPSLVRLSGIVASGLSYMLLSCHLSRRRYGPPSRQHDSSRAVTRLHRTLESFRRPIDPLFAQIPALIATETAVCLVRSLATPAPCAAL